MARITLAERMSRLEAQKARLARDEAKLKADLSRLRTRRWVEAGQLVARAGLLDLDQAALFGALLAVAAERSQPDRMDGWRKIGQRALDDAQQADDRKRQPLTVIFAAPLPTPFATRLKAAGLRFDKHRHVWKGTAELDAVGALAAEHNGVVKREPNRPVTNRADRNGSAARTPHGTS